MKSLLIIGAGGHGRVVAEIAADLGYEKIGFIDDNAKDAIGKIEDLEKWLEYKNVFCGIGNNALRRELLDKAEQLGFSIPVLVHPTAYVSKTAKIENGTVIEPKAIVNANTKIGKGCIVSVGAIIDHDVIMEDFVHANAGSIVKAGAHVEAKRKLEAGEVVLGYDQAVVRK